MTWIALAISNASPADAARAMRCDYRQAARRLEEAKYQIATRHTNCLAAATLLTHSGYKNPRERADMSARNWQDVALGLKQAS